MLGKAWDKFYEQENKNKKEEEDESVEYLQNEPL